MRRLIALALAVWIGRWALRELAALAAPRLLPRSRPALESSRQPGRMPAPGG